MRGGGAATAARFAIVYASRWPPVRGAARLCGRTYSNSLTLCAAEREREYSREREVYPHVPMTPSVAAPARFGSLNVQPWRACDLDLEGVELPKTYRGRSRTHGEVGVYKTLSLSTKLITHEPP